MNDLIKSLAEKANIFTYRVYYTPVLAKFVRNKDEVNKFAELIIRECASIGDSYDPLQDGAISKAIKNHFGIK
jgi:hypothetical protein